MAGKEHPLDEAYMTASQEHARAVNSITPKEGLSGTQHVGIGTRYYRPLAQGSVLGAQGTDAGKFKNNRFTFSVFTDAFHEVSMYPPQDGPSQMTVIRNGLFMVYKRDYDVNFDNGEYSYGSRKVKYPTTDSYFEFRFDIAATDVIVLINYA